MTEETTPHMSSEPPIIDHEPPAQIPPADPTPPASEPRRRSSGTGLALLALLGVIGLAAAVAWLRLNPEPPDTAALDDRLAAVERHVAALDSRPAPSPPDLQPLERRIAALEQRQPPAPADVKPLEARIAALEQRQPPPPPDLKPLDGRIAALEHRAPPDLGPLDERISALEKSQPDLKPLDGRVAALEKSQPDLQPLDGRIAALERSQPDLRPLDARVAALEQKPAPADTTARAAAAALAARLDSVASRDDALSGRAEATASSIAAIGPRVDAADAKIADLGKTQAQLQAQVAGLGDKLSADVAGTNDKLGAQIAALDGKLGTGLKALDDKLAGQIAGVSDTLGAKIAAVSESVAADDKKLAAAEQGLSTLPGLAERATRLTRLSAAQQALDDGQPLGAIDGAPPALAKFAQAKPPTEAQLRLAFPAAAQAAAAASQPQPGEKPFLDRAWAKAQTLVTVRQGDRVLVGDPSAGLLAKARSALDAGDLQGAADAAGSLTGPAAAAMSQWVGQARDLLAARAALAALAAHG
jgi:hypothetical protein